MHKKTAVLGFGNPVRSDDGVGCFVIDQLRQTFQPLPDWLTLLDMGTSAFEMLFQLQGHERILLVDAVINSGEPDGTLFQLPAQEAMSAVQDDPLVFLHSLKWDQALSYAQKIMGPSFPDDLTVFLIAVSDLRLEVSLSEPVREAGLRVCQLLESALVSTPETV
ncbi:MAG TPA: hydrogenase maturation protease [Saprospiraceae bacterium]|nr:hydrogenase maturation protease [Saprospiraceae bacterium]HNL38108.1 hydrogenase maturation protease [Saprospiraceae bacterium]HNM24547.1 hydrogenase maturation protease [Saprospiraceae bacterium]